MINIICWKIIFTVHIVVSYIITQCRWVQTFRSNVLPTEDGGNIFPRNFCTLLIRIHCAISQKTTIWIFTAIKTSNLIRFKILYLLCAIATVHPLNLWARGEFYRLIYAPEYCSFYTWGLFLCKANEMNARRDVECVGIFHTRSHWKNIG